MRNTNLFAVVSTVLTADVANSGTFTVGYPTGYVQNNFTAGLNRSGSFMIVNGNDKYTAAQLSLAFGASLITVTNSTGVTLAAGSTVVLQVEVADGNDIVSIQFPCDLASVTGTQDVVTDFRPGVDGEIEDFCFITNAPATTAAKLATFNLEINATNLTGGVIALTTVGANTMGKIAQGTDITAANTIKRSDTLSIEASAVTAFVEGRGTFVVRIRRTAPDAT